MVVIVVAGAAVGVGGVRGRGPLGSVLCPVRATGYAQVPYPAPPLTRDVRLPVEQAGSVGGYGDPLPPATQPGLVGDRAAVRVRTVVEPTEERCGRVVAGYRFFVLTAVRPGRVTIVRPGLPQVTVDVY
jgi:hypothetical protein